MEWKWVRDSWIKKLGSTCINSPHLLHKAPDSTVHLCICGYTSYTPGLTDLDSHPPAHICSYVGEMLSPERITVVMWELIWRIKTTNLYTDERSSRYTNDVEARQWKYILVETILSSKYWLKLYWSIYHWVRSINDCTLSPTDYFHYRGLRKNAYEWNKINP